MANQKDVAVECIAEEARPPPKFTWFLGEDPLNVSHIHINKNFHIFGILVMELLIDIRKILLYCICLQGDVTASAEDKDGGKKNYIETLKYFPSEKHNGKTLRCQVEHQAYTDVQKNDKQNEAEVLLKVQCKYSFIGCIKTINLHQWVV